MKKAKLLFCFAALVLFQVSANAQAFLTNGLIAYYPFNGNANDESGNGNHGITEGAVGLEVDRHGKPNAAYGFGGYFAQVRITNAFLKIGWSNYTISGWICTTNPSQVGQTILNTDPHVAIGIGYNHPNVSGTYVAAFIGDPRLGWVALNKRGDKSGYENSKWYQVVLVKSNSAFRIYVDGVLDNSFTADLAADLYVLCGLKFGSIGIVGWWGYEVFNGKLDDFRVYQRALSPSEVAALYRYESGPVMSLVKYVSPASSNLLVGTNYQLQVSPDRVNWTNSGAVFKATNTSWTSAERIPVANWGEFYFRLRQE